MYKIKDNVDINIKQVKASKVIGITQPTLSKILNGKVACRKVTAYCITKYINAEAEIEDYFDRVE